MQQMNPCFFSQLFSGNRKALVADNSSNIYFCKIFSGYYFLHSFITYGLSIHLALENNFYIPK